MAAQCAGIFPLHVCLEHIENCRRAAFHHNDKCMEAAYDVVVRKKMAEQIKVGVGGVTRDDLARYDKEAIEAALALLQKERPAGKAYEKGKGKGKGKDTDGKRSWQEYDSGYNQDNQGAKKAKWDHGSWKDGHKQKWR